MIPTKPSVLLIDDVEANLIALEAQLSNLNCELVKAQNGNEALKELLKGDFAVMLLDVQMPDMDGYEVAKYARQSPSSRNLPIIFITATHETQQSIVRGYSSGAVDFLFKPVDPYVLRSKVQVFLDLNQTQKGLAEEIEAHKRTVEEIESFNYSVSHDLRAPLRPLAGFSQILLEDYGNKLDDRARNYLERIRAAAQRMDQLIDDMLLLSRISRAVIRNEAVDLARLAESIIAELASQEPHRNVEFVVHSRPEVRGDPRLLRILFENILRNAWKFTSKKPHSKIEFGAQNDIRNNPVYMIRDNGAGFDPMYSANLFRPFQRLHSITDFEGTGVGLAISERIVKHHGGRIWAESVPNEGATFFFTLSNQRRMD